MMCDRNLFLGRSCAERRAEEALFGSAALEGQLVALTLHGSIDSLLVVIRKEAFRRPVTEGGLGLH